MRLAGQWCSNRDGPTEIYGIINEVSRSLTRLTDNPALAYEYRGGETHCEVRNTMERNSFEKGAPRRIGFVQ